jgi:hypothetical protein
MRLGPRIRHADARGIDPPGRLARRLIGAVLGVLLLGAAVWAVLAQRPVLDDAIGSLRHAPPALVCAALALPLVSWLATSVTFWLLSGRYARVPARDMAMLIGASWLLNHLPFRPGMIGRVAYHRKYHGMAIRDSVRVMISAMALSGVSLGLLLIVAIAVSRVEAGAVQGACLTLPSAIAAIVAVAARAAGASWWREVAALAARSVDMLTWVGRYAIVFALIGEPLKLEHVVAVTAVCQIATVVPITGNGLGLREWAVGLTLAAVAAPGLREQAAAVGLAGDLLNRAAETMLAVPVGLTCSWLLARKVRGAARGSEGSCAPPPCPPGPVGG